MKNKEQFYQKTLVVWMGALFCCLLWGSAFPGIKIGYEFNEIASDAVFTQIMYAGMRFTLAGVIAIAIGSGMEKKFMLPTRAAIPKILVLCLFQTILQYVFFYLGLARTSGVKASIIEGVNVFVACFVAGGLFKLEKITSRKIIGCIIGFLGVILVNVSKQGIDFHFSLFGEGFIFFSTIAYAFSSVFLKYYSKDYPPVLLSGYQFLFGGLIMWVAGMAGGGHISTWNGPAVGMLIYLALVSSLAYSLWAILLKYNPVSKVAVFGFMNPVFGVILSAWLLQERNAIGFGAVLALALVCVGIYIVNGK